ncbi:TetR family transcriptional regulator [Nocardia macrotermitis]|uniref:HTH-type transcriptional regulator BetI n=1 Tax=Nocardia macrotermitis TaxID=2585198 RepID=A0A7K0CVI8_9NOCA|nr:TetR family transcriptional regulator [Nocardia macrotermitis]MQY17530.1 HTH-type transcriptional regulator BetI [Nocardia macrotermitis]
MDVGERSADDIGARVRAARTAAGVSLRETARRIGVSAATLSAVENGRTGVSVPRLRILARELGTTVSQLIGERDAGPEPDRPARSRTPAVPVPSDRDWREFPPLPMDPALEAAVDSFVETGYHGATMRSIADRAGMSVPGVYHHYSDKQQLLVRALDLTMDELHWRVPAARDQGATPAERLAHTVEALALFHTHRRKLAFIGASEMRSLTEPNRRRITSSRNEIQYLLDAVIAEAVATRTPADDGIHIAGRAIATMCTALPQWFRLDGTVTPEQLATRYADFALRLIGLERPRN